MIVDYSSIFVRQKRSSQEWRGSQEIKAGRAKGPVPELLQFARFEGNLCIHQQKKIKNIPMHPFNPFFMVHFLIAQWLMKSYNNNITLEIHLSWEKIGRPFWQGMGISSKQPTSSEKSTAPSKGRYNTVDQSQADIPPSARDATAQPWKTIDTWGFHHEKCRYFETQQGWWKSRICPKQARWRCIHGDETRQKKNMIVQ